MASQAVCYKVRHWLSSDRRDGQIPRQTEWQTVDDRWTDQWTDRVIGELLGRPQGRQFVTPLGRALADCLGSQPVNAPPCRTVNQPACQPANLRNRQHADKPICKPANLPTSELANSSADCFCPASVHDCLEAARGFQSANGKRMFRSLSSFPAHLVSLPRPSSLVRFRTSSVRPTSSSHFFFSYFIAWSTIPPVMLFSCFFGLPVLVVEPSFSKFSCFYSFFSCF